MMSTLIGTIIGREILVKTISDTSDQAYDSIKSFISSNDFYIKKILEELDIHVKIETINTLMNELEKNNSESNSTNMKTSHQCLHNLHDIIDKINNVLKKIDEEIKLHKQKWFHTWRKPNYYEELKTLITYNIILDQRLDLFIKIHTI